MPDSPTASAAVDRPASAAGLSWVLAALLAALGAAPAAAVTLTPVVAGLTDPTYVTHAGDGTGRLFILERPGRILVLQPGATSPTVFLDIAGPVGSAGSEEGLLGLAFHPSYASNGHFYVYYTNDAGNIVVERYTVTPPNADSVLSTSAQPVLQVPHPTNRNHNGGQLAFGPDGFLYIGVGDGGAGGDPPNNAQNLGVLLGKILRIDVDGGPPYAIPPGNPFGNEIWALGLRNPYRFSFDRATGGLLIADVGQSAREEIDFQPPGVGGLNYCWRRLEGTLLFNAGTPCSPGVPTAPVFEYGHDHSRCSVTGGYAYRGSTGVLPAGAYVFADFCSGEIFLLQNGFVTKLLDTTLSISSFGEDQAGELYVVDLDGTISRLTGGPGLDLFLGFDTLLPRRRATTLTVGVGTRSPGGPIVGDAYAGAVVPGGSVLAFLTSVAPPAVAVLPSAASPALFPPLARGVTIAPGDTSPVPIVSYTFSGGEPAGEYLFFVAVFAPGALLDGRIDPGDLLLFALQPFSFTP